MQVVDEHDENPCRVELTPAQRAVGGGMKSLEPVCCRPIGYLSLQGREMDRGGVRYLGDS